MAPRIPKFQHFNRLRFCELFLDTFIYTAHSTASDALWAGVRGTLCAWWLFGWLVVCGCFVVWLLVGCLVVLLHDFQSPNYDTDMLVWQLASSCVVYKHVFFA